MDFLVPLTFALAATGVTGANELSLDAAVQAALQNQPQIAQARANAEAAEFRVRQSRSALFPELTATARYERSTSNFAPRPGAVPSTLSGTSTASSFDSSNYWSGGITLSQTLFDFGQSFAQVGASRAGAAAQKEFERNTQVQVAFNVRWRFFQARAAKALLAASQDAFENQTRHLKQSEAFVQIGTRPPIDLVQAQADVASARLQLINAENTYRNAIEDFKLAMGADLSANVEVGAGEMGAVEGEQEAARLIKSSVATRPDVRALDAQIESQQKTARSLRTGYLPTLQGSTGFTDSGEQLNNLAWNWNAGVTMNWQIFSGGQTYAQVSEAERMTASLQAQREATRQQAATEIQQAVSAIRAGQAAILAGDEALRNARERLRLAEGRYEAGLGNAIELGDAQTALITVHSQQIQTRYQLEIARAQLLRAMGRI